MIVIGALLYGGFVAIAVATFVSLSNGAATAPPDITDVPFPAGTEVIGSHARCTTEACDGHGIVVDWESHTAASSIDMLAGHLESHGWVSLDDCTVEGRCMASGELRAELVPWASVDPGVGPVMRAAINERDLDESELVYVRLYRCGILTGC
jgi:hypothetical protein